MAEKQVSRYIEELDEMLANDTITQDQYDRLADLSAAKEAIKNHDQTKRERDEAVQKLRNIERQPVRDKVFSELGVDLESLRPAEKQLISSFDWEGDEPDKDKAAEFVSTWGLPTTQVAEATETNAVDQIVGATSATSLAPIGGSKTAQAEALEKARNASSAEEAVAILSAHGITEVEMPK